MFTNVTEANFVDAFMGIGEWSDTYKNNFSYDGLKALFEWLEDLDDDTGEPIQFDRVGIACDFNEYESIDKFNEDYGKNFKTIEQIGDETTVIPIYYPDCKLLYKGFIIQAY